MLSTLDLLIIGAYFALMIALGWYMRNQAKKSKDAYLMGGKTLPWYMLGLSDASDMFDISGTMLLVSMAFLYGFKSGIVVRAGVFISRPCVNGVAEAVNVVFSHGLAQTEKAKLSSSAARLMVA